MQDGGPMPTAIFDAKRRKYIVPSRDIHQRPPKRKLRDKFVRWL